MPEDVPFRIEGRLPEEQLHQLFDFLERTSIGNSVRVELGGEPPEDVVTRRSLAYAEQVFDPNTKEFKLAITADGFRAFAVEAGLPTQLASRAWNAARNGFNSMYDWEIDALKDIPRITFEKPIANGRHTINALVGFEPATFHESLYGLIENEHCLRNAGASTVAFYEAF